MVLAGSLVPPPGPGHPSASAQNSSSPYADRYVDLDRSDKLRAVNAALQSRPIAVEPQSPERRDRRSTELANGDTVTFSAPLETLTRGEIQRTRRYCYMSFTMALSLAACVPWLGGDPTVTWLLLGSLAGLGGDEVSGTDVAALGGDRSRTHAATHGQTESAVISSQFARSAKRGLCHVRPARSTVTPTDGVDAGQDRGEFWAPYRGQWAPILRTLFEIRTC